ncbi:MAG TPA: hypothetical protein VM680_10675 [Verrucomicrobiae bacterium]|nr:hypothetical protein [Verrucomicrobiae bacterium]
MISKFGLCARVVASMAAVFLAAAPVKATVVDDFNDNVKTGWSDFTFGAGSSVESGGQLNFSIPMAIPSSLFFASTKATETYTVEEGKTIELRADLISASNDHAYAVLSWIPNSQSVSSLAGYGLAKSPTDILITKGINKYFHEETPATAIKNDNVTLVLILTMKGGNVIITGKVLDKDNKNAVLFEKTYVDTPAADSFARGTDDPQAPYTGAGKINLIDYADKDASVGNNYDVAFDNVEAFVLENAVVDNFDDNSKTQWADHSFGAGSSTEANGQFNFSLPAVQDIFFGSSKTTRSYEVLDGQKLEFRVDLISANRPDAFAVLAWIPNSEDVKSLVGYGLTLGGGGFLMSKGINRYFFEEAPPAKTDNVTMALTLERRGTSMVLNGRVYDRDAGNALIFERTFVDTANADAMARGTDSPIAPFSGPGKFVLILYEDFNGTTPPTYEVVFDNAWAASPPLPSNTPPTITEVSPESYRNFVAPTANITFKVNDDAPAPAAGIAVTLNGTRYTSANGLTITPSGNSSTVSLGGLVANENYIAKLEATDAGGVKTETTIYFDTFAKNNLVIEAEDYNFDGGSFIDNPVLVPVDGVGEANGYRNQAGAAEVDFHSTRTSGGGLYRPDQVTQNQTLDFERDPFLAAGGKDAGYVDYDVSRIRTGEWQRYTRTFPAGTYEIYLRQAYFNVPSGEVILEKVNGEPSDPDAPVEILGSFLGFNSGAQYRNVALTDASGANVVAVQLDGRTTLRLRQVTAEPSDGDIYQNYMIFVPTAAVINRPRVVSLTPGARSTTDVIDLHITATLQDRDTTVNTSTVELYFDGSKVAPSITTPSVGTTAVDYAVTPLPPSGTVHDASLRFTDSAGVRITNDWSFTLAYRALSAANRVSSVANRGFNVRVVQAPAGSDLANSLQRAEEQLAANSTIAKAYDLTTTADIVNYAQNADTADGHFAGDILIPGLDSAEAQGTDDIAMEVTAYLELPAGTIRFGVTSDDGFKLSAGPGLHDQTPIIDSHNNGTADQTFDVLVPAAGFYPVRLLWYERGGGAHVEFFTVDPATGERTLVNDPNTATAIKAYRELGAAPTIAVYSSATVDGTFTADGTATVDTNAKRITIPIGTGNRFYRVSGNVTLSSPTISSSNLTFTYQ